MPFIAHYEVYVLEPTGWVLHARFASDDKAKALDEARAIDAHLGRPAKVVRESYDPDSNRADDQTVFLSPRAVEARKRSDGRAGGYLNEGPVVDRGGLRPHARIPEGLEAFADSPGGGLRRFSAPTHARSTSDMVARVTFVIVASLVLATTATALIPVVINMLRGFGVIIGGTALSSTLFAAFMVVFLTTGFFLTLRLVPLQGVAGAGRKPRPGVARSDGVGRAPAAPSPVPPAPMPPASDPAAPTPGATPAPTPGAPVEPSETAAPPPGEPTPGPTPGDDAETRAPSADPEREKKGKDSKAGKEAEKDKKKDKEAQKKKNEGQADPADVPPAPPPETEPGPAQVPAQVPESPAFQTGRNRVMDFLSGYVGALKTIRPRLDTYNRFGINLYLAGACQVLARKIGLSRDEFQRLLQEAVEIMGTRPAQAASFVRRLDSYLEESRYSRMVQSGREAMNRAGAGGSDPFASLGMVVEDWNTPKIQKVTASTIAIVFTDMVGSTDLTSEHGDQIAQDILRAHNSAVRSALGRFAGKEIKHTGDGIMATFDQVPDAVAGMIDALKAVRAHNEAQPRIPLRIRIGINAGEPISAENDYYGLAVTIAARICAKADMDQILVSQVVRDMCEGTDLMFADRGSEPLKGIKEPMRLHEALWEGARRPGDGKSGGTDAGVEAGNGASAGGDAAADTDADADAAHPGDRLNQEAGAGAEAGAEARARTSWPEPFDPNADGWLDGPPDGAGEGDTGRTS